MLIFLTSIYAGIDITQYESLRPGYYNMMYNRLLILLMIIHFILIVYFHKKGRYRSKKFAMKHIRFAIIFPLIGYLVMPFSYDLMCLTYFQSCAYSYGFLMVFLFYGFLIYVATLPYWVSRFQQA